MAELVECLLDDPLIVNLTWAEARELSVVKTEYSRVLIKVRTMGNATTISIGTANHRNVTFTGEGEGVSLQAPPCRYYDLSKVFAIADNSGAVLEVWGTKL